MLAVGSFLLVQPHQGPLLLHPQLLEPLDVLLLLLDLTRYCQDLDLKRTKFLALRTEKHEVTKAARSHSQ